MDLVITARIIDISDHRLAAGLEAILSIAQNGMRLAATGSPAYLAHVSVRMGRLIISGLAASWPWLDEA